jgi:hypothetical protein
MSGRYLGVISIERFLAVERYRQSHPAPPPARPAWTAATTRRLPAAGPRTARRARGAGGTAVSG